MKRILFVIPSMEIGGTRSSLMNLLNNMEQIKNIDVELFIINHEGELLSCIPKWVRVLPEVKAIALALPNSKRKWIGKKIYHLFIAFLNRLIGYQKVFNILYKNFGGDLFNKDNNYDTVIAYQEGISTFTASLISAKKHIAWIHSDVDKWYNKRSFEWKAYNSADYIVFVAENTRNIFIDKFPQYSEKCCIIKNTLNKRAILEQSQTKICQRSNIGLSLLSIGRFTEAKAFDRIILAASYLKSNGYKFIWTIIGDGDLYDNIKRMAHEYDVQDVIIFKGAQSNPFPYIKDTDVVVVSSIYESQPMVILEALTLSKPVVSTNFGSANEILQNGKYGLLCDNETTSFIKTVELLFTDNLIIPNLQDAAKLYDYDNDMIIKQLISII